FFGGRIYVAISADDSEAKSAAKETGPAVTLQNNFMRPLTQRVRGIIHERFRDRPIIQIQFAINIQPVVATSFAGGLHEEIVVPCTGSCVIAAPSRRNRAGRICGPASA